MPRREGGVTANGSDGNGEQTDPFDWLDYPCRFEIKAMGRQGPRFDALVQKIVSRHVENDDVLNSTSRVSRGGRYVSVTCTINAQSKQQIRAIYADLAGCPDVLVTL